MRAHAKASSYLVIDKMVVEHPEFEFVKNKAKAKVLERVMTYKANMLNSPSRGTPGILTGSPSPVSPVKSPINMQNRFGQ